MRDVYKVDYVTSCISMWVCKASDQVNVHGNGTNDDSHITCNLLQSGNGNENQRSTMKKFGDWIKLVNWEVKWTKQIRIDKIYMVVCQIQHPLKSGIEKKR